MSSRADTFWGNGRGVTSVVVKGGGGSRRVSIAMEGFWNTVLLHLWGGVVLVLCISCIDDVVLDTVLTIQIEACLMTIYP